MFASYNLKFFGKELKKARRSLGLTQANVQALAGISIDTLRKIENGHVMARYDTLELLSGAYKQDLLELLKNCRANKFLIEFHDDVDYIIACYDKAASASLRRRLIESFPPNLQSSLINPDELKQFLIFVDAIDAYYSEFSIDRETTKRKLINALRLTISNFTLQDYGDHKYSYIEFRMLLLISLFIAKEGECLLSNEILYFILKTISHRTQSTKFIDFLTINIYLNIAYNYHILDEHAKVINTADAGISYCLEHRLCHGLYLFYYRKGIAQFNLGDTGYLDSIVTSYYTIKALRMPGLLDHYQKITEVKYGIKAPSF